MMKEARDSCNEIWIRWSTQVWGMRMMMVML
jgi:hypothetical protein